MISKLSNAAACEPCACSIKASASQRSPDPPRRRAAERQPLGTAGGARRPPGAATSWSRRAQAATQRRAVDATGAVVARRPRSARLSHSLVDLPARHTADPRAVRRRLPSRTRLEDPGAAGVRSDRSDEHASATRKASASGGVAHGPPLKKKPENKQIVFVDETGVSERPHRCRTWAPRGQTPVTAVQLQLEDAVGGGRADVPRSGALSPASRWWHSCRRWSDTLTGRCC